MGGEEAPGGLDVEGEREDCGEVVGAAGTMPVLAYHYPAQSAPGIALEDLKALKVAGLKDSTGDPTRLLEELAVFNKPIYVGSASMLVTAGVLGCTGAILAAANLEPELCAEAFEGKVRSQKSLLAAHRIVAGGIPALKAELARRHGTSAAYR